MGTPSLILTLQLQGFQTIKVIKYWKVVCILVTVNDDIKLLVSFPITVDTMMSPQQGMHSNSYCHPLAGCTKLRGFWALQLCYSVGTLVPHSQC